MSPLPALAEPLLDQFDDDTVRRGREIFARGAVSEFTPVDLGDAAAISGTVDGGATRPYQVYAMLEEGHVAGDCTCPAGADCEHVVALLLAAAGGAPDRPIAETRRPVAFTPGGGRARMVYLLDHPRGESALFVCPARRSPDDADALTPYALHRAAQSTQPAYVTDEDLTILRRLAALATGTTHWLPLPENAGDLFTAIAATGRCHWLGPRGPSLHEGAPLVAAPVWQLLDNGFQRLIYDLAPPEGFMALPLRPPIFIHPATGEYRKLTSPPDTALAAELTSASDLPPHEVDVTHRRIDNAGAAASFPRPRRLTLRRSRTTRPVPYLVLGCINPKAEGAPGQLAAAWLGFEYEEAVFDWADRHTSRVTGDHTVVIEVQRDEHYERQCVDRLSGHGLTPAHRCFEPAILDDDDNGQAWIAGDPLAATDSWVGLQQHLPQLRDAGWRIEFDPTFPVRLIEPDNWYGDLLTAGSDDFELDLGIELDGRRASLLDAWLAWIDAVSPQQLRQILQTAEDASPVMLRVDETRVVLMPRGHLKTALRALGELIDTPPAPENGRVRLSRARLGDIAGLDGPWRLGGARELVDLAGRLAGFSRIEKHDCPEGLKTTLRPYQQAGLNWLQFLREYGFGGILADDMGLGKTVQTLAHLLAEKQAGRMDRPCLVIAPTSLVLNWRAEARRFAPELSVLILHGVSRKLRFHEIPRHDLVLSTYPLIARDIDRLNAHRYHLLILDEAQTIKNPGAKLARLVREIDARHRLCLTGTPLENHLGELWSLFDFLMPGLLGARKHFGEIFRTPIERHGDNARRDMLARRIKPFFLRRTKREVAPELPRKSDITRTVALTGKQRKLYESVRRAMHDKVRRALDQHGAEKSRIIVLDALLKLRQICCDPRLPRGLEDAAGVGSAKLELLLEMLPEMLAEGRRVLLFSQFVRMLELILPELKRRQIAYTVLTGKTRDRERAVARFQEGRVPLFLVSLKAGGVGLNLTAADTVIHYDPWWNPAVEDQATDRAHRIGQRQTVFVYRLLTEDTVEERVHQLQQKKRGLIEGLMGDGGARTLDADDLEALFRV